MFGFVFLLRCCTFPITGLLSSVLFVLWSKLKLDKILYIALWVELTF